MRRAALYARVSTRKQEQEATIESQMDQLLQYARGHEFDLPPERQFVDQAVSGKRLARPGLDRLRDAVAGGEFEVLLCLSPDRLARNLGAQQVVLAELERYDIQVVFLNQPRQSEDPHSRLLLEIQGAFAEYERTLISERMRRGRLYRLRQGQSVTNLAPYGYQYQAAGRQQSNAWLVLPEEAALVRQIFVEYTSEQISLSQIAHRLNTQNIPAPRGGLWQHATLQRLLRQPAYKGTAYYHRCQVDEGSVGKPRRQGPGVLQFPRQFPRPVEDWICVKVPALVDEALWQAAPKKLPGQLAQAESQIWQHGG
jgi:site-specific DNA recombinase